MSIFWKEDYEPTIIDKELDYEKLQEWLYQNNIFGLNVEDNLSSKWAGFCQYYGRNHGLGDIESGSFAYVMSLVMGSLGVSCGTDIYFDEERIDTDVINKLNKLNKQENLNERQKVVLLFDHVFELYKERIGDFEFKTKNLCFRVTKRQYDKFHKAEGQTKTEKFENLLKTIKD